MTSPVVDQIQVINARLNDITTQRVTYVAATVSSNAATTFGADIAQPDGTTITLTGIGASPHFMPPVGTAITLALSGAQVVLVPAAIADGSVTPGSLSPNAPAAPTGLTLSTSTTVAADGTTHTVIGATWTAPTLTVGGTALIGTVTYVVQYRITGSTNWTSQPSTTVASSLRATPGSGYDVEVAAVDRVGNVGAFSSISTITAGQRTVAPGTPSTPTVSNYLGQLKITWDGLLGGSAPGADFDYVEVHASATTGFTPSTGTLVGQLSAGGSAFATATYTTTMFAKLVAVDTTGNRSTASAQGSGSTSQVVSADIFNGAVGSAQLASLAVTTAKINNLAVNDAQIGNMNVGKLVAGTMTVDVVMGGRFTTALTGARVEMNSTGFQKYNSSGGLIVSITGTDNFLYGEFRTATTGRRIEIGVAGTAGQVNFTDGSGGALGQVRGYTASNGVDVVELTCAVASTDGAYNGVTVQDNERIYSISNQVVGQYAGTSAFFEIDSLSSKATGWTAQVRYKCDEGTGHQWFTGSNVSRMVLGGAGFAVARPDGTQIFDALESINPKVRILPTGIGRGDIEFWYDGGFNNQGGRIVMTQVDGGGAMWKVFTSHFEARDLSDAAFVAIDASAFNVSSDVNTKTNVQDLVIDAASKIRGLRPRTYQRKPGKNSNGQDMPIAPPEIGLIAQESPAEILTSDVLSDGTQAINIYAFVTLLATGLQQALITVDALTGRVTQLEGKKVP